MHIELTEAAARRLSEYALAPGDRFRLVYDADGCGCAVSGIAALWLLADAYEPDEKPAGTNVASLPFTYLARQEVFFDERLRLDYAADRRAFRLSSDGQIYGNGIVVNDRRAGQATPAAPQ